MDEEYVEKIDNAIYEAEKQFAESGRATEANEFFEKWEKKHKELRNDKPEIQRQTVE